MQRDLQGRVAVVTGASGAIGRAIALRLAGHGAHVVLSARGEAGLREVATEIERIGGQATVVAGDVTLAEDRQRLVERAEGVGPIEVLVNNAGVEVPIAVVDQTPEDVERTLAVNLAAPIQLSKLVLPSMIERGRGVLVGVSSMSGKSPVPYNAIYTATKHGLNGFSSSLRIELLGTGVHSGVVCPGFVAGEGVWGKLGISAPRLLPEVTVDQVADAVERVIDGAGEVLVSTPLARPLLAVGQLFPRLDGFLLRRLGILSTLEERAEVTAQRRSRS